MTTGSKIKLPATIKTILNWLTDFIYRIRDLLISALGLLILLPFFGLVAILIKRDSPGPVFYWGNRMGKGGRLFKMLKFRTMYDRPESFQGLSITTQDDPRITTIGRWLRDTKINELPQLWNVLIGEMSLIGPRPEVPEIVENWPDDKSQIILSTRPGITSPASVLFRDEQELLPAGEEMLTYLESLAPQKMRLDLAYVNHRSFFLDLDVLFWTLLVLIPRLGEYKLPEEKLFWGPISRFFKQYFNWFTIDALTAFIAFGASSVFLRAFFGPLDVGIPRLIYISIGFALLFSIIGALYGVQRIFWSKALGRDVLRLIPPVAFSLGISLIANLITQIWPPRLIVLGSTVVFFGYVFVRFRGRMFTGLATQLLSCRPIPNIAKERVLIIGCEEDGQSAAWTLQNNGTGSTFQIVGFIDDNIYNQGLRIQGVAVLGKRDDIPSMVDKHEVGVIIFAMPDIKSSERQKILDICNQTNAQILMMPDFVGNFHGDNQKIGEF